MSALLLSASMDPFYQNIASFPTVIYTFVLALCTVYWAGAILGIIDIDILHIDGLEGTADGHFSTPDALAGLMLKFGLVGVPVTVSLSILALIGWLLCYYSMHLLMPLLQQDVIRYLVGIPIFASTLFIAAWITGYAIRPLRTLFSQATQETYKHIIGQTATVRTSRVDNDFGEAVLNDGGAGLLLKVRSTGNDTFHQGDRVVIFEKLNDQNIYRVISEAEFTGRT